MSSWKIFPLIVAILSSGILCKNESDKCIYIHEYMNLPLSDVNNCKHKSVCNKTFDVYYLRIKPYYNKEIIYLFEGILKSCCGCFNGTKIRSKHSTKNYERTSVELITQADFLFPIAASSSSETVYGRYFIPLYEMHGAYYITIKKSFTLMQLLTACLELWPLLIACILMAILSGFVAWILETWVNKEEFPRQFFSGWFEGIWWSFISMTTVGYGDKAPKSIGARLFAIAWILTGIIIFGILTSSLTSTILEASTDKVPTMVGSKVGSMRSRIYDENLIVQRGGYLHANEYENKSDVHAFYHLLQRLTSNEIHGFLLDKYTFWKMRKHANMLLNDKQKLARREKLFKLEIKGAPEESDNVKKLVTFFINDTIKTDVPYVGEKVFYGILVKHYEHYQFFKDAVLNNKMVFERVMSIHLFANNSRIERKYSSINIHFLFRHEYVMITVGIIVGVIISFGIIFEAIRYKRGRLDRRDVELGENRKEKCKPITPVIGMSLQRII